MAAPITWRAAKSTYPNWMFRFCSSFFSVTSEHFLLLFIFTSFVNKMQLCFIQMLRRCSLWRLLISLVLVALAPPVCGCSIPPVRERLLDSASPVYQAVQNLDQDRRSGGSTNMRSRSFQVLAHMTGTRKGEVPLSFHLSWAEVPQMECPPHPFMMLTYVAW